MADIVLMDGGLGQEISNRSGVNAHPLWSIKVMLERPEIVTEVHHDFLKAGARVVGLNTYAATPSRMTQHGYADHLKTAHETAIRSVHDAIALSGVPRNEVSIAACLPPLVASYVAEKAKDYKGSLAEFRELVALQNDGVDVFLVETMSNWQEAKAGIAAAHQTGKPVYVSFTLKDDMSNRLRSGEDLSMVVEQLADEPVAGVMVNCSYPEAITAAMLILSTSGLAFGGYGNGFTSVDALKPGLTVDELTARKDLLPDRYAEHVYRWIETGANIVGGCCEISPEHIAVLAKGLNDKGHRITSFS